MDRIRRPAKALRRVIAVAYRLLVDLEVLGILEAVPKNVRRRLLDHFAKLRSTPESCCDYYESDSVGRPVAVSVFAGYSIHYWIDAGDQHVKILAVKPADGVATGG